MGALGAWRARPAKTLWALVIPALLIFVPWTRDIDLSRISLPAVVREWFEKLSSTVPTRDTNAVYQDDQIVGKVEDARVDTQRRVIWFAVIHDSVRLELSRPFVFRKYRLRTLDVGEDNGGETFAPWQGRIVRNVTCEILGVE